MKLRKDIIKKGFVFAGVVAIGGVLILSRFFTNGIIPKTDPNVMSNFGLLMIVVWGLAFIAASQKYEQLKWLILVFIVEKFIYGYTWANWLLNNDVGPVYREDAMAGIFYAIYGLGDWFFFFFFIVVFIQLMKEGKK